MTTIKTLLVDDEFLALNLLENFIGNLPDLQIVGKVKSPMQALDILQKEEVDLLFLDIQMPTLSGNQLLRTLPRPPATIFTTAYAEFAPEAFDLNAVDYLLKPFSFERFLQAVNKAREQLRSRRIAPGDAAPAEADFFSVKVDGKVQRIRFDEILFIEGLKEYVRIHTEAGRFVTLESLQHLEQVLPEEKFMRVHKSYIVAVDRVRALNGNLLELGTQQVPLSRRRREEVVTRIFRV